MPRRAQRSTLALRCFDQLTDNDMRTTGCGRCREAMPITVEFSPDGLGVIITHPEFGFSRMLQAYEERRRFETQVFRDRASAEPWITAELDDRRS